jgi:hypothetical protein
MPPGSRFGNGDQDEGLARFVRPPAILSRLGSFGSLRHRRLLALVDPRA